MGSSGKLLRFELEDQKTTSLNQTSKSLFQTRKFEITIPKCYFKVESFSYGTKFFHCIRILKKLANY
jgi:hypothetical protein